MKFFAFTSVALLAGIVAGRPTAQDEDPTPKLPFHIAFTFSNGTYTDPIDYPDTLDIIPTNITDIVEAVFFSPPGYQVWGRCTFLEPDRQGLGFIESNRATTVAIDPPAVVGYVQCNTT